MRNPFKALKDPGLVRKTVVIYLVSTAVLVVLFGCTGFLSSSFYDEAYDLIEMNSYPIDTAYCPGLLDDDFSEVTGREEIDAVVFAEDGTVLFATDKVMADAYRPEDAQFIDTYDGSVYWAVAETAEDSGDKQYYLAQYRFNEESGEDYYIGSNVLDENLVVTGGDLLPEGTRLTANQIGMMRGTYSTGSLYKYEYQNRAGDARTMIYTEFDDIYWDAVWKEQYEQVSRKETLLYAVFFLLVALIIVWQAVWVKRSTRRCLKPLETAIATYGDAASPALAPEQFVTELRPVVASFQDLMERIEAADAEKEQVYAEQQRIIADISHDLRTPLTVIQGYSQAFLEGRVPEEKEKTYMRVIHDKSVTGADMINMLFDYTKMEHPDFAADKQTVDLTEVTADYLADKQEEVRTAGDELFYTLPDYPISYNLDIKLLCRLYDNLINNAVKHNKEGTTVRFSLEERRFDIRVTIADNGQGIPEEIRRVLFDPFVTGNAARPSGGGTGLGVTIAKRIVDLHGGSIRLLEPPEEGWATQFEIILHKS